MNWFHQKDSGERIPFTAEEVAEIEARIALEKKQQEDFVKTKYQRDRAAEYPSIPDQLDLLYHQGIDGWKAVIQAVKDKYPKG